MGEETHHSPIGPRDATLVAVFFAGPVAYMLDLIVSYMLVRHAMSVRDKTVLHVVAACAMVLDLAGLMVAWSAFQRTPHGEGDRDAHSQRQRFMAAVGMTLCAFFALIIVAGEIPNLLVHLTD